MPLTPESWTRVAELFDASLAVAPERRAAFVSEQAAGDEDIAREVSSLLAALDTADGRFERPAISSIGGGDAPELVNTGPQPGDRIGPYQVVREVGHGGMGAVYEAVRADDQYRKRVAIKTIWRGGDSALIVRRFRQERQILAGLDHSNIAALLDGGMDAEGRPYLVMEYVEGKPIDEHCAAGRLSIRARIALVRQVCAAVQYAHRNLVVHRDIKPNNILVSADGVVKLVDFGISKLVTPDADGDSTLTRAGLQPRTTTYASPEQVRGELVATASDIYSLGVVLYELLAGRPPFAAIGQTPHHMERRICEEEPARPSTVATEDAAASAALPDVQRLRRALAGELDDIVMVALRKEPERRYASVEQLSEDLRRYLEQLPVLARADTLRYRAAKFARRNRALVVTGTVAAAALLLTIGGILLQARVAAAERDRARAAAAVADRERATAEQVSRFLQNMLGAADPSWYSSGQRPGPTATIGEVFDDAGRRVEIELASQPEVLADVLRMLGRANQALLRLDLSQQQLERAYELHRQLGAPRSELAADEHELGMLHQQRVDIVAAESWMRRALASFRAAGDSVSDMYGRALGNLGNTLSVAGRTAEAEPYLRAAAAHRWRFDSLSTANAILAENVALVLGQQGKLEEAEPFHREALRLWARDSARATFERSFALSNYAIDLTVRGRTVEAIPLAREAVTFATRKLGARHPTVGVFWIQLARVYHAHGDQAQALAAARHGESIFKASLPLDHPNFHRSEAILGRIMTELGRYPEAERHLRRSLALRRAALAPGSYVIADAEGHLGVLLLRTRRYAEAEPLLLAGYTGMSRDLGRADPRVLYLRTNLATLYEATGRPEQAKASRDSL